MSIFGKPAVTWLHPLRLDMFVRSSEGTLVHTWLENGAHDATDLGGFIDLFTDPVAVRRDPQRIDVFAKSGLSLLHWRWVANLGRMVGPDELPGYITDAPVAVADGDRLYVFSSNLDGQLKVWQSTADGPWSLTTVPNVNGAGGALAASLRTPGRIDVYTGAFGIEHWLFEQGQWTGPVLLPGSENLGIRYITAFPDDDRDNFVRADVYGLGNDAKLFHWGEGFLSSPHPTRWWGPDTTLDQPVAFPQTTVAAGPSVFFRDSDGLLHHWHWNLQARRYDDITPIGRGWAGDPVAVTRGWSPGNNQSVGHVDVVGRTTDASVRVWNWTVAQQTWSQSQWELPSPRDASGEVLAEPVQDDLAGATDDVAPEFLVRRPADHVVLGLHTVGYRVQTDGSPRLVAEQAGAHVVVTFPPQHIAEEVSKPGAAAIAGNVWNARLAGPTRVAFSAPDEIELTTTGLLTALNLAAVDADEQRSAIELPWGLILAPRANDAGRSVITRHSAQPVDLSGTTGLWRTRLGTEAGDGGLDVKGLRAGRPDPFPVALSKANRVNIAGQFAPAHATRLELSSLGGSLTASGRWSTLEWDHHTVCGRDERVRTATKGVLFPMGHRAVFVETSERSPSEPVAVIRKSRTLYVTEATRFAGALDAALVRTFPFSEVEILALQYPDLDDAIWQTAPRPTEEIGNLEMSAARVQSEAEKIADQLLGPDWELAGHGRLEDLAAGGGEDPNGPLDPDDPEGATRAGAARTWLELNDTLRSINSAIAALRREGLDTEQVETFFAPMIDGSPVRFPVRCRATNRDVLFELPLLFVADLDLNDQVRERFQSLRDPKVFDNLRTSYQATGGGVVELPGVQINMSPVDEDAAPGDIQEVYRLNVAGNQDPSGGYRPSLGRADEDGSWAAEIALPTMRTLLGADPRVRVNFDQQYVSGAATNIPLRILGAVNGADEIAPLAVDFTSSADRSGGLAAPKYIADGISRVKGLVNVAGTESLQPADLFSKGASLFGFDLRELVTNIAEAPEVVTVLSDAAPPVVRLTWENIDLNSSAGGDFVPLPGVSSKLTINVVSSPTGNESSCTLTNFKLAMPPGDDALIEITFSKVEFRQQTGHAPTVSMEGLGATFVGKLRLLQKLQDVVNLGDVAPQVIPSPTDITARYALPVPDVEAFSFVMSNLVFSAALCVPFGGDPVSVAIGFASRERPFTLTVLMFGGGGYLDLELDRSGLRRLEVSLQFGAAIGMNFGIGSAEVHAFGGIRYELVASSPKLTGFIHIGGSVEVLGLVSVAVELRVELSYDFDTNALVGRAKVVIEIDTVLFSDSVELDSGEWRIAGGAAGPPLPPPPPPPAPVVRFARAAEPDAVTLQAWRDYRGAFA
jgi:hypothetical protein